jgi:hypothetical protein
MKLETLNECGIEDLQFGCNQIDDQPCLTNEVLHHEGMTTLDITGKRK